MLLMLLLLRSVGFLGGKEGVIYTQGCRSLPLLAEGELPKGMSRRGICEGREEGMVRGNERRNAWRV